MSKPYLNIINKYIANDLLDRKTIANLIGKSQKHLSNIHSDPELYDYKANEIYVISRYMAEAGHTELADCFSGPQYQTLELGTSYANGTLDDEVADMTVLLGKALEAHRRSNSDAIRKIVSDAHSILERITAEGNRL